MAVNYYPKLRPLDFQPVHHQGEQMWLLRDPWQLSERQLILPQALAQLLLFLDGTRSPEAIHAAFCRHIGGEVPFQIVTDALAELDKACLLANERSFAAQQQQLDAYRSQPFRPPALAGLGYPDNARDLAVLFDHYSAGATDDAGDEWQGRGVVSPHIDYQRGGPVYAQVWAQAAPAVLSADLVLIFGTDHNGSPGSITLTHLPYATPYGVLPVDTALVNQLAGVLGKEEAFAEELNHRGEHSVELSAVWLHHVFVQAGRIPCPVVPILVGSFYRFIENGHHPAGDHRYNKFLAALQAAFIGRRVLVVGSVDLAHVGPAFGDNFVMDETRRKNIGRCDEQLIAAITTGNAAEFYRQIAAIGDRNRICGFAPLYLMLRLLGPTTGHQVAYKQCPADAENQSLVSICGLLLT